MILPKPIQPAMLNVCQLMCMLGNYYLSIPVQILFCLLFENFETTICLEKAEGTSRHATTAEFV